MWIETVLIVWTGAASAWWIISTLAVRRRPLPPPAAAAADPFVFISVFKPLPRLYDSANLETTALALLSFIRQLDNRSELLLGIHPDEVVKWRPFLGQWKRDFPFANLKIVIPDNDRETDRFANRKVAWQSLLAPHAMGELWLWSDADITAPGNYLEEARAEQQSSKAGLLTHSYVVRSVRKAPDLLNALFVNVEIYPGVRFVGRRPEIYFGLGAGLFFSKKDFLEKVDWADLGSYLADDFVLGSRLGPVRLGSTVLETFSGSAGMKESVLHYLRWQKTIRWCQPSGFAAQIFVLPVLGWLACALVFPFWPLGWTGLAATALLETLWVALLFRFTGCRPPLRFYCLIPAWSVFRVLAFAACWLPWPVIWRSQAWWGPVRRSSG